ncbi:MAG: glycosyltransferase family 2 protein [Muribaculaceae bacterium]|nr:glycosyltransferase family 2 protein [Muribaculaceae bacterium]
MQAPITVVIPVYNRAHIVERMLRSLDSQTVSPQAVVLVDNGSTDASLSILQQWASQRPYAAVTVERRRGACCARNCGLAMVQTPWVMFVDSDDRLLPTHIEDYARAIERHPEADMLGRNVVTLMPDGRKLTGYFIDRDPMFHHIFRAICSTARVVYRTELAHRAGGWNESLGGWDDWELGIRLLLQNPRVVDIGGTPTYQAIFTEESLTGLSFSARPHQWELALRTARQDVMEAERSDLIKWLDARAMVLAAQYAREGSQELARGLYDSVMATTAYPQRMRLLYHHNRLMGRLTWALARVVL